MTQAFPIDAPRYWSIITRVKHRINNRTAEEMYKTIVLLILFSIASAILENEESDDFILDLDLRQKRNRKRTCSGTDIALMSCSCLSTSRADTCGTANIP